MSKKVKKYVIVRGKDSGVFAGYLDYYRGQEVKLLNARKLWYWDGACAVEQIARDGVSEPKNCKFTVVVNEITISDFIQIIPTQKKAQEIIEGVKAWKR
jgi:hypothetical protein